MAKMFYTMEETKVALDRSEEEIKTLSREGKLREFRDGPRLMFKADQVDALKANLPSGDRVNINDSGAPIALADSKSGTAGGSGSAIPIAGSGSGMSMKDDTSLGGSFAGGSRAGGSGVNIFSTDDADNADPSAQTAITPASESANLEAVGSGSGLLDLTRESDDTSLGAVLDEVSPGSGKRDPGGTKSGSATGVAMTPGVGGSSGSPVSRVPIYVTRQDSTTGFFTGLATGAGILSLAALWLLSAAVTGAHFPMINDLAKWGLLGVFGMFAVIALVVGAAGFGLGKVLK